MTRPQSPNSLECVGMRPRNPPGSVALFQNCESVAIAPQGRYGDGPSIIDLTQDAEYGQFARNLPERSSVALGRAPIEALCRKNQLRIAFRVGFPALTFA